MVIPHARELMAATGWRPSLIGVNPCFFWFQGTLTAALVARPRPMQRYVISSVLRFRAWFRSRGSGIRSNADAMVSHGADGFLP